MNLLQHLVVALLSGYRWVVSPAKNVLFGPGGSCRFTPTCSAFAQEAVRCHGVAQGGRIAIRRLCRCHPWGGAGDDPVPRHLST